GRDHHPDHALHRGGRGHGRPDRRDQPRRDHPGRGQGRAHAQARQEAADPPPARGRRRHTGRAGGASPHPDARPPRPRLQLRYPGRAHRHHRAAAGPAQRRAAVPRPGDDGKLAGGHLRRPGEAEAMNLRAVKAIYTFEMARTARTLLQSIVSPVISTSLYFVVFGAAIGSRITEIEGVSYGAFIVPGLIMLTLLTQSVMNASFGIYFPRFTGTIYEILSAPVSS